MTADEDSRPKEPGAAQGGLSPQASRLIYAPLLVFAALVGLFLIRLFSGDASRLPSAMIGKQVPAFALSAIEGLGDRPGFSDADLRQGGVTLVNVFASWCIPCHQEHAALMAMSKDETLKRLGVRIAGLAYKDDPANIRKFLGKDGDPYAMVGADRGGRTAIDWGVYGVPETYIVKGDGAIAYRFVGPISEQSYKQIILPEIEKAAR